jgi:hypothetical protein
MWHSSNIWKLQQHMKILFKKKKLGAEKYQEMLATIQLEWFVFWSPKMYKTIILTRGSGGGWRRLHA